MGESEQVFVRAYLDALSGYERVNKEAIAIARQKVTGSRTSWVFVRDPDADPTEWPEPDVVRDVMIRWHNALVDVLRAWERVPHNYRTNGEGSPQQLAAGYG
jgi:hypothetical protein